MHAVSSPSRTLSGRRGVIGGGDRDAGLPEEGWLLFEVPAKPPSFSGFTDQCGTHVSGRAGRGLHASQEGSLPQLPARRPEVPGLPLSPPGQRNSMDVWEASRLSW